MSTNKTIKSRTPESKPPAKKKKLGPLDYQLMAVVIILICFGLIMLYSASSYEGLMYHKGDDKYFFTRQSIFFVAAIIAALVVSRIDYHRWVKISPVVYWGSMVLMSMVWMPGIGIEQNGARRWIGYNGFSFQPSEFAKIGLILMLASLFVSFGRHIGSWFNYLWLLGTILIPFLGAFLITQNLSTACIIFAIGLTILLVFYPNTRRILLMILLGIVVLGCILLILKYLVDPAAVQNFRIRRVVNWLNHDSSTSSQGTFQVTQALYAIGSGGLFGKGLGNSTQKYTRVPEAQNDMIFSIICEELGLFGAILLLILFGYLLYRLYYIAKHAPDLFGSIIASGIMIHFALQIILNIAVVCQVVPTTGISLPFVSYGGTAIMFLMGEVGICLNISRQMRR